MTQEQEIKGILVNFFREGTKGDYMDALHDAIKEISQVKNCLIADVVGQSEQLCDHPRSERTYIGQNMLRCNKCGKEFS